MNTLTRRDFLKIAGVGTAGVATAALVSCAKAGDDTTSTTDTTGTTGTTGGEEVVGGQTEEVNEAISSGAVIETVEAAPAKPSGWTEADATETVIFHTSSQCHNLCKWGYTAGDFLNGISNNVFDPVLMREEDGTISPWLAESYTLAPDYMTLDFKFREDVYFTDGRHFTAEDFVYTFELIRADTEHYPDSNAKTWRNYLSSVEQTGEYTATMHFSKVMPTVLSTLTAAATQVISKAAVEEMGWDNFWASPIGTGPYKFKEVDLTNSIVTLEIRDDEHGYWAYKAHDKWTNIKTITYAYAPEATTRIASIQTGEVHMIDQVPASEVESLSTYEDINILLNSPSNLVFLQFACGPDDLLHDQKICEALTYSIDRELIVEQLVGGFGTAARGHAADSTYYGYDVVLEKGYTYDPDRAKAALDESSYNNEELRLIYTASTVAIGGELTQALQQMWLAVGLNVKLEPLDVSLYDSARSNHDFDIVLANIGASSPYAVKIFTDVIGTDKFKTHFVNDELKALGVEVSVTADVAKLDELVSEMISIELETFQPNCYLYFPRNLVAYDKKLTGLRYHTGTQVDFGFAVVV